MVSLIQFSPLLFLAILAMGLTAKTKMDVMYEWKYIDYVWPSEDYKGWFANHYEQKNPILFDVDRSQDGRTFVTVIMDKGIPATLNVVSNQTGPGGPLLKPYPDWSWYRTVYCDRKIVNVYRIAIDKCNRLWVLDSGVAKGEQACPAKLIVFDLKTNRMIRYYYIPLHVFQNYHNAKGLLVNPIVQTEGDKCEKTTVFIADPLGNGLIVLDYSFFWRFSAPYFSPDPLPNSANATIAGETFTLEYGLFGMALTPKIGTNPQELFFRPFASRSLYAANINNIVRTRQNRENLDHETFSDVLPSQSSAQAFSSEATLFFGLTNEIAIGCWNRYKDMNPQNIEIVAQDDETLQFASGVKVIPPSEGQPEEELWVSTNRYQKSILGTINFNEVNYRVMKQSVKKLIAGTNCEAPENIKNQNV